MEEYDYFRQTPHRTRLSLPPGGRQRPYGNRDHGKAPPVNRLHVWWARRPLTPSRAAILASLLPADYPPDLFLRRLGIEKVVALVHGRPWTLTGNLRDLVTSNDRGEEVLEVDDKVLRALEKENRQRTENLELIAQLPGKDPALAQEPVIVRWEEEEPTVGTTPVRRKT